MPDPKLGKLYDVLSQKDPSVVAGLDRENFITKFSGDKNMRKLYEGLKQKRPEFVSGVDADAFVGKFKEAGFWDKIGVGLGTGKVPGKEEEKLAPSMNFAEKTVAGMLGSTAEANAAYEQDLQRQTGEYSKELADAEAAIRDPNSSMPIKQDAYNKYKTAAEKLADKSKALLSDFDKFDEAKFETTLNTVKALQKQLNATSDPLTKQQIQDKLSPHMEYLSTLEQSDNFKNYVKANEALNRSRSLRNALFPEAIKEEAETKAKQTAIDKESQATEESGGIISNVTEHLRNLNVDVAQSLFNVANSLEGMVSPITNKLFSKEAQAEYRAKRLATVDSVNNYLDSYKPSDLKGSYKEEYVPLANGKSIVYDNGQVTYGRDKNGYMYEPTEQEIAEAELAKESKGVKNRRNTKVLGANFQKVVVDLATQIALGRGMGALGVNSATMSTSIPTALQSFGEYYTEAIRAGEDDTTAYASAAAKSVSDALLENIGGLESKLLGKGVGQPILNRAKADVRKKFLEGTIGAKDLLGEYSKYVMSKAGESVKQGVGEVFEEVLQGVGQDALDNAILGSDIDIVNKQIKGFEETALLSFGVGAGASSIKEFATVNTDFKKNIHVNALNQMILDRGNLDNILNSANVTDERRAAVKAQVNYVTNELEARGISDNIQATGLAKLKWDWEYALQEKEADGNMSDTAKAKYTDKIKEIDTALDELAKEKTTSSETGDTTEAAEPDTMGGTATNTEGTVEPDATTTPLSDDELAAQAAAKQAAQDLFGEDAAEDTPEEDTSIERSVAQRVLLSDVIGDSLFEDANGNVGTIDITEEGEVEFSYGNNVVKLGNTSDLGDASVAELGLTPKRVDGEDSGKVFSIGDTKYVVDDPSAVTYDKDGKVESVRALRVEDGKTVAVELRGPEAQEIAYRVKLKELYDRDGEENTKSRIAEAVGQLEEVSGDADVAEVEDTKQTRRELPGTSYTTENGRTYTIDSYDKKGNVKFQYEDHNGKTVKGTWDKAEFEGFIADGTLTKSKGNPAPKITSTPAKGKSTTTTAEPVTEKTVSEAKVASPKKVAAIGRMTIKKGDRVTVRDKEGNVIKRNVEVLEVSPDKKTVKTEFKGKFSVVPIEQIENLDAKSITNAYKEAKKNNTDPELVEAVEALAPKQKTKEKTKEDALQIGKSEKKISRTGEGGQDKSKDSAGVGQSKQGKEAAKESKKESIGEVTEEEFVAFKNTGLVSPKRLKSIAAKQDAGEALTEKEKTIAEKKQKDIDKIKEAAVPKEKTKEQLEKEERQRQYEEDLAAAKERAANAPPPPPVVEAPTITVEPTTAKTESPKAPKPKVDTVVKATVKGSSKKAITKFDLRHLQRLHAAGVKFTTKAARSGGLITANVGDVLMNKDGVFFTVQDVSGGRVTGKLSYVNDKGFVSENRNPTDVRVVDISDIDFPADTSFDIDKQVEQVTKALGKIVPGLTVNVLSDAEYKAKFKDNSRGKYQRKDGKVTITINRDTAKDNTVFHEAAHAVFVHYYGTKSKDIHIIHRTIREALNTSLYPEEQELAKQLDKFIERDPEDIKPHEYLAELVGFLSANRTKLTGTTVGERMVEYLNNMFEKLLGIRPFTAGSDINSIIKLVNNIAVNLAEGQVIEDTIEAAKDTDVELDYSQKEISSQLKTSQSVAEKELLDRQIPSNARTVKLTRLSKSEESGRSQSGKINAEATIITSGVHEAITREQGISNPNAYAKTKQLEEQELIQYALKNDLMLPLPQGEIVDSGNESDIYLGSNLNTLVKVNNANNNNSWLELLDGIAIHNSENPSTPYTITGFTKNADGEFSIVLEQNRIVGKPAEFNKIHKHLIKSGFKVYGNEGDGVYLHKGKGIILEDVKEANVIEDGLGNLHFIDTDYYPYVPYKGGSRKVELVKAPATKAAEPPKVTPQKQLTLFNTLFGKEKGEATNRLVNRIKKNIAKRLGISVNEYNERLVWAAVKSIPTSVNELINSIGGLMAQRDLQEAKVLYQEELLAVNNTYTPSKAMLAKVEGMTEKDVWLAKLIETYQPLRDFINRNYSVQVDQSARERVNTLQAKLATLVKDGKKDSAEFADTKEELEDYKSVIAQEKKGRVNMAAVKTFIASELSSISNIAENSDNYYIKEFPQNVIDDRIDQYKNKDYNPDELLRWEAMLDPQVRADTVAANATAQKADLKGIITYLNNGEYSPEFALYLLNDILAYDYYTKDGNVHKRPRKNDTINSFNLVSPMVVGGMYRDHNSNSQKSAYLEYLSVKKTVKNVDKVFLEDYAKYKVADTRDGFWVKFDKGNEEHYSDLHAAAATTQGTGDWCTGSSLGTATAHLNGGDFYIHLNKEGKATLAIRYEEDRIGEEPRGLLDGQNVRPEDSDILSDFLLNTAPNGTDFIDTVTQNKLIKRFLDNGKQPLMDLTKEEFIFIDTKVKRRGYKEDPNVDALVSSLTREVAAKSFGIDISQVVSKVEASSIDDKSSIVVVLGKLYIDPYEDESGFINLEYARAVSVSDNSVFTAPKLTDTRRVILAKNSTAILPSLERADSFYAEEASKLVVNNLKSVTTLSAYEYSTINASNLEVIHGQLTVKLGANINFPKLHTADYCEFSTRDSISAAYRLGELKPNTNTLFSLPRLKSARYIRANANVQLDLPDILNIEEQLELYGGVVNTPNVRKINFLYVEDGEFMNSSITEISSIDVINSTVNMPNIKGSVSLIFVSDGQLFLPEVDSITGRLEINGSIVEFPNVITTKGELKVAHMGKLSLPKATTISGDLIINDSSNAEFPNVLSVDGDIIVSDYSGVSLPAATLVNGAIRVYEKSNADLSNVQKIYGNLVVGVDSEVSLLNVEYMEGNIDISPYCDVSLPNLRYFDGWDITMGRSSSLALPRVVSMKADLDLTVTSEVSLLSFSPINRLNYNKGNIYFNGKLNGLGEGIFTTNNMSRISTEAYLDNFPGMSKVEVAQILANPNTEVLRQDNRAAIVKTPNKSIILLSKNADVTSPLHEMAHEFESVLSDSEKKTILKWAGTRTWNTDTSEAFAKGFEKYLYEGKSPSQELKAIFEKFANWLKDLLRQADFDGIPDLNEDMRNIYAAMLINESSKQGSAVEPRTAADNMADIELSQDDSQREEILQKMADAKYNVPAQVLYNVRQAKFDALGITVADIKKALGQETPGQESVAAEAEVPVEPTADREQGALEDRYHEFVTKVLRSPNVSEEVKEALRTNSPLKDVVTFEELRFMSDKFMEGIETVEQIKKAREVILHTFGKATGTYLSGWQFMALTNLQQLAEAMNQPKLAAKLLETIGSKSVEFGRLIASLKAVESQDLAITILNSKIFDKYNERDYYTGRSPIQAMESFISEILPDDPDVERYLKVLEAKINAAIFDNANSGNIDLSQNGDYDIEKFIKAVLTPKKSGKSTEDLVARSLFAMRRSKNPSTKPDKEVLDELATDLRKKQVTLAELAEVKALIAAQSMSRSPAEMAQLENAVEDTIAYVTGKSIGHAKLRKAIQDALGISDNSKLKEAIVELARDRVKGEDLGKSLIEQIINRTGVSPETAKKIEDEIRASYNEVLREAVDKKVKEASDKLLRHDIEALEKKLAELKKDPKLDFEAKTVERLLDAAIARKNKHLEKEGDRILKAMSAISLRTAEAKAQADAIEKIKADTSKTIAQKKKEIDAIKKEQEKTRKILKELKAEEKIAKAEDSKKLNEAYLKEKATLEIEIADIKSDPVLSDPEKEVRIRAVNNRLAKLDKAITKFNEAQETAKDKARTELVWLIDKNKSQKNLLEIFAHDSFTADDVMEHFQKAYKVVPPLTANELRELRRLSMLYKTATREVDKAAAFSRLVEYMTDRIDRTGDKGFLAEVFFEYAYTNLLSSAYTAIKAFTIGVKEFLSTIGFDILSIAPSIISGNLKSNLINVKDAWKAGLAGTRRSGPSLIEGLKTGNVVGQVDSTELHRLLGAGQFLSRQSVRYTSGTYTPSKYKALDALAIVGSVFWRVFSTMSRLLVLADMATKAFTIPYYRTRVAYYQLLKDPTSVGADPTDVSLLASIDRKLTDVTSLEEAVENDAVELGLNFESNFTVPTNASGNPISGKEYTAWRKGLYEHAKKLGYPLDENLQRLTGAAMAKWKKERLVKLAPEFLTAGLGKMADDAAKSMAQQETATGNIYGTMGSILNPIIDKRHDRETGFFPKFISWIALPFARATGIMINLLLKSLPTGILQTKREGDRTSGKPWELGLRNEMRVMKNGKVDLEKSRSMTQYELSQMYFKAFAPTIMAGLAAAYLFDLEQCEEEDPRLCVKLANRDIRFTGSTKIPTANAEFYGDGWQPNKIQKKVPGTNKWETTVGYQDWAMGTLFSALGNLSDKLRLDPDRLDKKDISGSIGAATKGAVDYFMNFGFESALKVPVDIYNLVSPSYDGSSRTGDAAALAISDRLIRPMIPGSGAWSGIQQTKGTITGSGPGDWRSGEFVKNIVGDGVLSQAVDKVMAKTIFAYKYGADYDVLGYKVETSPRTVLEKIVRTAIHQEPPQPKAWAILNKFPELEGSITYYNPKEKTEEVLGDRNFELFYKNIPKELLYKTRKDATLLKRQMIEKGYEELNATPTPQEVRSALASINKAANEHAFVANIIASIPALAKENQDIFKTEKKSYPLQIFDDRQLYTKTKLTDYLEREGKIIDNGKLRKSDAVSSEAYKTSEEKKKIINKGH